MTSYSSLQMLALLCGCATCGLSVVLSSIYLIIWFLFLVSFYLVGFWHHNEGCDKIISCVLPGFCWLLGDKWASDYCYNSIRWLYLVSYDLH